MLDLTTKFRQYLYNAADAATKPPAAYSLRPSGAHLRGLEWFSSLKWGTHRAAHHFRSVVDFKQGVVLFTDHVESTIPASSYSRGQLTRTSMLRPELTRLQNENRFTLGNLAKLGVPKNNEQISGFYATDMTVFNLCTFIVSNSLNPLPEVVDLVDHYTKTYEHMIGDTNV